MYLHISEFIYLNLYYLFISIELISSFMLKKFSDLKKFHGCFLHPHKNSTVCNTFDSTRSFLKRCVKACK